MNQTRLTSKRHAENEKDSHLWKSFELVRPKRFELLTPWFVAKYSIQLSYGRIKTTTVTWRRRRDSNPRYKF